MDHLVPWLTLKSVPGIGNLLCRRLLDQFGTPGQVLSASRRQLMQVDGISTRLAAAINRHTTPDGVYREIDALKSSKYRVLTQTDKDYPHLLLHIPDPPPVLYIHGNFNNADCQIAVVGSRKATVYGRTTTRRLCAELVDLGIVITSGMARGIDTCAHRGALAAGGKTIAVLGSGLASIYPPENRKLFDQIAENGAVMSEFALQAGPEAGHFPQRNRIISGMSLGTIVVEAAHRSGSLITARLAAEQGREVFAVPGSIQAPTTQGTHSLIQQGAKLVQSAGDVLEELTAQIGQTVQSSKADAGARQDTVAGGLSEIESSVLAVLEPYPLHIDQLSRRLDVRAGQVAAVLSKLEIKGMVVQEAGKYFYRHQP